MRSSNGVPWLCLEQTCQRRGEKGGEQAYVEVEVAEAFVQAPLEYSRYSLRRSFKSGRRQACGGSTRHLLLCRNSSRHPVLLGDEGIAPVVPLGAEALRIPDHAKFRSAAPQSPIFCAPQIGKPSVCTACCLRWVSRVDGGIG